MLLNEEEIQRIAASRFGQRTAVADLCETAVALKEMLRRTPGPQTWHPVARELQCTECGSPEDHEPDCLYQQLIR